MHIRFKYYVPGRCDWCAEALDDFEKQTEVLPMPDGTSIIHEMHPRCLEKSLRIAEAMAKELTGNGTNGKA